MENRKMTYRIKWIVSPLRKDKRTGVVNPPAKLDRYNRMLFEEVDQQWKKNDSPGVK